MITDTVPSTAQILGIAPQFLVDDLNTAIAYLPRQAWIRLGLLLRVVLRGCSRTNVLVLVLTMVRRCPSSSRATAPPPGFCLRRHLRVPPYSKRVAVSLMMHPCEVMFPAVSKTSKVEVASNVSGPVRRMFFFTSSLPLSMPAALKRKNLK